MGFLQMLEHNSRQQKQEHGANEQPRYYKPRRLTDPAGFTSPLDDDGVGEGLTQGQQPVLRGTLRPRRSSLASGHSGTAGVATADGQGGAAADGGLLRNPSSYNAGLASEPSGPATASAGGSMDDWTCSNASSASLPCPAHLDPLSHPLSHPTPGSRRGAVDAVACISVVSPSHSPTKAAVPGVAAAAAADSAAPPCNGSPAPAQHPAWDPAGLMRTAAGLPPVLPLARRAASADLATATSTGTGTVPPPSPPLVPPIRGLPNLQGSGGSGGGGGPYAPGRTSSGGSIATSPIPPAGGSLGRPSFDGSPSQAPSPPPRPLTPTRASPHSHRVRGSSSGAAVDDPTFHNTGQPSSGRSSGDGDSEAPAAAAMPVHVRAATPAPPSPPFPAATPPRPASAADLSTASHRVPLVPPLSFSALARPTTAAAVATAASPPQPRPPCDELPRLRPVRRTQSGVPSSVAAALLQCPGLWLPDHQLDDGTKLRAGRPGGPTTALAVAPAALHGASPHLYHPANGLASAASSGAVAGEAGGIPGVPLPPGGVPPVRARRYSTSDGHTLLGGAADGPATRMYVVDTPALHPRSANSSPRVWAPPAVLTPAAAAAAAAAAATAAQLPLASQPSMESSLRAVPEGDVVVGEEPPSARLQASGGALMSLARSLAAADAEGGGEEPWRCLDSPLQLNPELPGDAASFSRRYPLGMADSSCESMATKLSGADGSPGSTLTSSGTTHLLCAGTAAASDSGAGSGGPTSEAALACPAPPVRLSVSSTPLHELASQALLSNAVGGGSGSTPPPSSLSVPDPAAAASMTTNTWAAVAVPALPSLPSCGPLTVLLPPPPLPQSAMASGQSDSSSGDLVQQPRQAPPQLALAIPTDSMPPLPGAEGRGVGGAAAAAAAHLAAPPLAGMAVPAVAAAAVAPPPRPHNTPSGAVCCLPPIAAPACLLSPTSGCEEGGDMRLVNFSVEVWPPTAAPAAVEGRAEAVRQHRRVVSQDWTTLKDNWTKV